jgi:hypothetical protein
LDWIYALVLELLLQKVNVRAQARVLALEALGVAARPSETGDAVGGATFGIVLGAWRAASRLRVTSYLTDLFGRVLVDIYIFVLPQHIIGFHGCISPSLSRFLPSPSLSFCNLFHDRTLHLSQAWPVRLEAPFLRAVAASEALLSYSMCRSCRECFGGMGGPASSSTGRFTGMAGLLSRCDGLGRRTTTT